MSAFGTGFEPGGVMGFLLWMNSLLTNHGVVVAIAVVMFFIGAKIFMMTKYGLIVKNFFWIYHSTCKKVTRNNSP